MIFQTLIVIRMKKTMDDLAIGVVVVHLYLKCRLSLVRVPQIGSPLYFNLNALLKGRDGGHAKEWIN